jgi:PAB1-binding protein PBP1
MNVSLESTGESWDQFQANEQKFGLKSDYNENIYTTTIDKSNPLYRQREAEAERIAQEIEGTSAEHNHAKEDGGFANEDDGLDEEDR